MTMKTPKVLLVCAALGTFLASGFAQEVSAGDEVKTSGLVTSRSRQELTIKTDDGRDITVVLTDDTKIEQPKGLFKLRSQQMQSTALMPGLSAEVEGVVDTQGRVTAEKVKFSKESLKVANQINAGLTPTNQAVQANTMAIGSNEAAIATNKKANEQEFAKVNERFAGSTEYVTKDTVTLHYPAGVSELDEKQKTELGELAKKTAGLQGFIVQVAGYTDSSGNASYNEQLSEQRAEKVVEYLQQTGNIPLRHIPAPGIMGASDPAASNESEQGRAENRRVVVKVLVNKGVNEQ